MTAGDAALYLTTTLAALAAVVSILRLLGAKLPARIPRLLGVAAGICAIMTLAFLLTIFLATDLEFTIVHRYSSEDMPTVYKLSGAWAGPEGSMVLWTSLILIAWMVEELRWWRRARMGTEPRDESGGGGDAPDREQGQGSRSLSRQKKRTLVAKRAARESEPPEGWLTLDVIRSVVMLVAVLLLEATLVLEPFSTRTPGHMPDVGHGLSATLRTPLMAIHPPIVFIGYALLTIPFAAAIGYLVRQDRRWVEVSRPWARMSWLMLTLGIGIGAMWAYETLGWGGYWAWDPVETSSLIPWVALTAFMHAQVMHARKGGYRYFAPLMAGLALFLILFATFVTRSGVWSSVHAYAGASSTSALERVSEVLSSSPSLMWIFITMWAIFLSTVALVGWRLLRSEEEEPLLPEKKEGESALERLSHPDLTGLVTVFLLSVATVITFMVLMISAGRSISPDDYHWRLAPFVGATLAFLVLCIAVRALDRRRATLAVLAAVVAGIAFSAVNPGGLDPPWTWLGAVLGMAAIAVILGDAGRLAWRSRRHPRRVLRRLGSILVHLGLAMVFTGYCFSNVPTSPEAEEYDLREGEEVSLGDWTVSLSKMGWERDTGVARRGEYWDTFRGELEVSKEGEMVDGGTIEVTVSWRYREYLTLTYWDGTGWKHIDGEITASDYSTEHYYIRVESPINDELEAVVDLKDSETNASISPWPALWNDRAWLTGQYLRVSNSTGAVSGFLVSVDGDGGNVTLLTDSGVVAISGSDVHGLYRRAYIRVETTDVFLHRTVVGDLYVTMFGAVPLPDGSFSANLLVKEVRGVWLLWWGMYLMAAGVVLRPLESLAPGRRKVAAAVREKEEDSVTGDEEELEVPEGAEAEDEGAPPEEHATPPEEGPEEVE